jgi:hypothetical protein
MTIELKATFDIASWDEHAFDVTKGAVKMTQSKIRKAFHGDIEGESTLVYLMVYAPNGTATFVGLERIRATIAGRAGSFVVQHVGTFADGAARAALTIADGSGSGELAGISGRGDFVADPNGSLTLSVELD